MGKRQQQEGAAPWQVTDWRLSEGQRRSKLFDTENWISESI